MPKNIYWTIKYEQHGWMLNHCHYTRQAAIAAYLEGFSAGFLKDKSWQWHKYNRKVAAVRVQFVEVTKENQPK